MEAAAKTSNHVEPLRHYRQQLLLPSMIAVYIPSSILRVNVELRYVRHAVLMITECGSIHVLTLHASWSCLPAVP